LEKAQVEEKNSGNSQKTAAEEIVPTSNQASNEQLEETLRVITEETLQLSEVLWQEEKLIKEFCVLLRKVLRQLNLSVNIPTHVFPQTERIQKIILNEEAHLISINDRNEVQSKVLEDFPPQIVYKIALFTIPELSKSFASHRKETNARIGLFERINQELRNFHNIFSNRPKKPEEDASTVDNGVKKALLAGQKDSTE